MASDDALARIDQAEAHGSQRARHPTARRFDPHEHGGEHGKSDAIIAELRDLRAEARAQRAALFRMLDRLGPPEAPA